jgi:hypothetical protein
VQHPAYRSMAFQVEGRVENSFGGTCILRARVQFQRCVKEPHVKAGISENVRHLGSWQGENGDKRVRISKLESFKATGAPQEILTQFSMPSENRLKVTLQAPCAG